MFLPPNLAFILLAVTVPFATAALPTCTGAGVGLWSEWEIAGNPVCSTSCGSCSKLFYTRACLTSKAGLTCIGDSTRYLPCNTKTCVYPAQKTCCNPYLPMLINGTMQCGPLPKDPAASLPAASKPCCPAGGLWTQWTKYARNEATSNYMRTRECATEDSGCPCTGAGEEYSAVCPCTKVNRGTCATPSNSPAHFLALVINDARCTGYFSMEASNDAAGWVYCFGNEDLKFVPVLRFQFPDVQNTSQCSFDRPFDCAARDTSIVNGKMPITFTCDLETLYWRYDYTGWLVTNYIQMVIV